MTFFFSVILLDKTCSLLSSVILRSVENMRATLNFGGKLSQLGMLVSRLDLYMLFNSYLYWHDTGG